MVSVLGEIIRNLGGKRYHEYVVISLRQPVINDLNC